MAEVKENLKKRLHISMCGERREIEVGKAIIQLFDNPAYVCIRVSKKRDSLIMFPCSSKEKLSFRVPDNLYGKDGRHFRICSKSFISEVIQKNGLDMDINYMIPGAYAEKDNCVVFYMADAYEHMK